MLQRKTGEIQHPIFGELAPDEISALQQTLSAYRSGSWLMVAQECLKHVPDTGPVPGARQLDQAPRGATH
jgi:hypothetical protein|tara:strand:- start:1981 stop:2190 length:210 start_codon:yes stop_codon:yes gene_type:complete